MKEKAKEFIKEIIKSKGITYKELSSLMRKHNYIYSENTIRSKINRGSFSFNFLLEVCESLKIEITFIERKK